MLERFKSINREFGLCRKVWVEKRGVHQNAFAGSFFPARLLRVGRDRVPTNRCFYIKAIRKMGCVVRAAERHNEPRAVFVVAGFNAATHNRLGGALNDGTLGRAVAAVVFHPVVQPAGAVAGQSCCIRSVFKLHGNF